MGNRAVITTVEGWENNGIGIYLHWNGGRDSIEAFLKYCKLREFRSGDYGMARLTQIISNFFGGGLSIGVDTIDHLDQENGDNGVYIIDDVNWEIVDRKYFYGEEQNSYDINEFLHEIDKRQPEKDRIYDADGNYHKPDPFDT